MSDEAAVKMSAVLAAARVATLDMSRAAVDQLTATVRSDIEAWGIPDSAMCRIAYAKAMIATADAIAGGDCSLSAVRLSALAVCADAADMIGRHGDG